MTTLATAKQVLLTDIGDEPWCRGIGIGLVGADRERGLVVSVAPDAPSSVAQRLRSLAGEVPIEVRVLGDVRKRSEGRTG